jgi:hypothetical protein
MLVTLAAALLVRETAEPTGTVELTNSPTLPAFALSFVVVPLMPEVLDGVIRPLAASVVNEPALGVVEPIAPGFANVAPPSVAALTAVLQVNPVFVVQFRALAEVLQLGIAKAVGDALEPVTFATTVFAACAASAVAATFPHVGAVLAPVDKIA